jgi:hypothetical protein
MHASILFAVYRLEAKGTDFKYIVALQKSDITHCSDATFNTEKREIQ